MMLNDICGQIKDDLIFFDSALDGQAYIISGDIVEGDSYIRFYRYDASSTTTADGEDILDATTMGVGKFIKMTDNYNTLQNKPTIPAAQVQSDWNATTGLGAVLNKPSLATVATSGSYNDLTSKPTIPTYTAGSGISIASNVITNTAQYVAPTINTGVSRALNSAYTISTTKNARVTYTIRIAYSITVLLGSTGSISLQYSTNGGTTYTTVSTISNSLALGLALTGYNDFILSGDIPANALVKLTSTATNATNTYQTGEEVLY